MILSILSMWICRIGMSYVLGVRMGFGVFGVWVAMTMAGLFVPFSLSFAIEAGSGRIRCDEKYGMFWGERKKKRYIWRKLLL